MQFNHYLLQALCVIIFLKSEIYLIVKYILPKHQPLKGISSSTATFVEMMKDSSTCN
jgi:hypothetical protein